MNHNRNRYSRRSLRLPNYDYSQPGAYFVTICAQGRECLFGEVLGGRMQLNTVGQVVEACWLELPQRIPGIAIDSFVVMPNHTHGIVAILPEGVGPVGAIHESPLQHRNAGE